MKFILIPRKSTITDNWSGWRRVQMCHDTPHTVHTLENVRDVITYGTDNEEYSHILIVLID